MVAPPSIPMNIIDFVTLKAGFRDSCRSPDASTVASVTADCVSMSDAQLIVMQTCKEKHFIIIGLGLTLELRLGFVFRSP